MELYTALHQVIKLNGESILDDGRLINMLTDYKAFEHYPATKNIMREVIDCKYLHQLINCKLWNMQAEKIVYEFVTKTGFQKELSYYVFQSIAFALGWVKFVPAPVESQNEIKNLKPLDFPTWCCINNAHIFEVLSILTLILNLMAYVHFCSSTKAQATVLKRPINTFM